MNPRHLSLRSAPALVERRAVLRGGLALGLAMLAPAARACEFETSTLTIVHPWTRATPDGATTAHVCMRLKDVREDDRLVAARTPVAERVELGGAGSDGGGIEILAGSDVEFTERGGEIRLVGLTQPLRMGRQFPLTLVFEKGGDVRTNLNVDFFFR